jgi:hypothetical protein
MTNDLDIQTLVAEGKLDPSLPWVKGPPPFDRDVEEPKGTYVIALPKATAALWPGLYLVQPCRADSYDGRPECFVMLRPGPAQTLHFFYIMPDEISLHLRLDGPPVPASKPAPLYDTALMNDFWSEMLDDCRAQLSPELIARIRAAGPAEPVLLKPGTLEEVRRLYPHWRDFVDAPQPPVPPTDGGERYAAALKEQNADLTKRLERQFRISTAQRRLLFKIKAQIVRYMNASFGDAEEDI